MLCSWKQFWLSAVLVSLLATACRRDDYEMLEGKWQLKTVEQGSVVTAVDTVWYNFQSASMFMYLIYKADTQEYTHCYGIRTQPDAAILDLELMSWGTDAQDFIRQTDWNETTRTFTVETLTSKRLVLTSGGKKYVFIKF